MGLSLLVEPIDPAVDGTVEVIGIGKGAVGEVVPLEVAPAALDRLELGSGACWGSHSSVSHGRSASALVVSLLVWIGPLSLTTTSGLRRSLSP